MVASRKLKEITELGHMTIRRMDQNSTGMLPEVVVWIQMTNNTDYNGKRLLYQVMEAFICKGWNNFSFVKIT